MLTFEMGALLRKRYNEFLGPYYQSGIYIYGIDITSRFRKQI